MIKFSTWIQKNVLAANVSWQVGSVVANFWSLTRSASPSASVANVAKELNSR